MSCTRPFLCPFHDTADTVCHERSKLHQVPSKASKRMLDSGSAFTQLIKQLVLSCSRRATVLDQPFLC